MPAVIYEIHLEEVLEPRWTPWFEGLELTSTEAGGTRLRGPLADKAALHGLLNRLYDLNLTLVSVQRIDSSDVTRQLV
jgi:hypothetical protein